MKIRALLIASVIGASSVALVGCTGASSGQGSAESSSPAAEEVVASAPLTQPVEEQISAIQAALVGDCAGGGTGGPGPFEFSVTGPATGQIIGGKSGVEYAAATDSQVPFFVQSAEYRFSVMLESYGDTVEVRGLLPDDKKLMVMQFGCINADQGIPVNLP